jgi:hypothetical protein
MAATVDSIVKGGVRDQRAYDPDALGGRWFFESDVLRPTFSALYG